MFNQSLFSAISGLHNIPFTNTRQSVTFHKWYLCKPALILLQFSLINLLVDGHSSLIPAMRPEITSSCSQSFVVE